MLCLPFGGTEIKLGCILTLLKECLSASLLCCYFASLDVYTPSHINVRVLRHLWNWPFQYCRDLLGCAGYLHVVQAESLCLARVSLQCVALGRILDGTKCVTNSFVQ